MIENQSKQKKPVYIFLIIFALWIIFFEFIFPSNNFLPKPSIVFLSFKDLFKDYDLLKNYLSTIGVIYLSLLLSYSVITISKSFILNSQNKINNILSFINSAWKILPSILAAFLLIYWLPNWEFTEFIFALLLSFFSIAITLNSEEKQSKVDYTLAAKGVGAFNKNLLTNVKWKSVQPKIINHIINFHVYFWMMIILFEYVRNGLGLGKIYRQVLEFNDLSALIAMFLITAVSIFLGRLALLHLKKKYFFWE